MDIKKLLKERAVEQNRIINAAATQMGTFPKDSIQYQAYQQVQHRAEGALEEIQEIGKMLHLVKFLQS